MYFWFNDAPNVLYRWKIWTAGRPIQHPDSSTMKPCCCNSCSMWFCIVLLKYTSSGGEHMLLQNLYIPFSSAGRYTGSYRIPVFIFLMIWIFKIPWYRCHLNHVRNATMFEGGFFSLLHCGEGTAVCVTKRESSETEAEELVEHDDTGELIHNIHCLLPSAPASHTHERDFSKSLLVDFFSIEYTNWQT